MPQRARLILVLNLIVREGSPARRAPVHKVFTAIDKIALVQRDKYFAHRLRKAFVERKPLAAPVDARSNALKLIIDECAMFFRDFPGLFDKGFAADLGALAAFLAQFALNDILGRNTGMIGARQPERWNALHPAVADLDILEAVVERMSHMEYARYVGWRNDNGKGSFPLVYFRLKMALGFPHFVDTPLKCFWVIRLRELHRFHLFLHIRVC